MKLIANNETLRSVNGEVSKVAGCIQWIEPGVKKPRSFEGTRTMANDNEGHLCLSRHKDESVVVLVGDVVVAEVSVASIRGDRVVLRLIADKTVRFVRSELLEVEVSGT